MILTGNEIERQVGEGKIEISPFNKDMLSTNSYDLHLGGDLAKYEDGVMDPRRPAAHATIKMGEEGYILRSGDFVLGHSMEVIGSDHYAPIIHARSGIARLGLFVHVTSDLIDIGSHGQVTFQLYATLPVRIYPGMRIGQVSFWVPKGEIALYKGRYQGSQGPRISEIHKDFGAG